MYQRGTGDFATMLDDKADTQAVVGQVDTRHNAEVGSEMAGPAKVLIVADGGQDYSCREIPNA